MTAAWKAGAVADASDGNIGLRKRVEALHAALLRRIDDQARLARASRKRRALHMRSAPARLLLRTFLA